MFLFDQAKELQCSGAEDTKGQPTAYNFALNISFRAQDTSPHLDSKRGMRLQNMGTNIQTADFQD